MKNYKATVKQQPIVVISYYSESDPSGFEPALDDHRGEVFDVHFNFL